MQKAFCWLIGCVWPCLPIFDLHYSNFSLHFVTIMIVRPILFFTWFLAIGLCGISGLRAQTYVTRKDASVMNSSLGCYQLSPSKNWVAGAVWNKSKMSLKNSFHKAFMLYFDNDDAGADGVGFVLHRDSRGLATDPVGGYIGYQNITPSFVVEFDIYYNSNLLQDTKVSAGNEDHIDLLKNGDPYSWPTLLSGGAVSCLPNNGNIEDGKCHNVEVDWDASQKVITVYFDGYKRVSQGIDLITDIFSGQDSVYWGFTGGTGGQKTNHYMCEGNLKFTVSDTCIYSGDTIKIGTSNNTSAYWYPQQNISCSYCASPKVWPTSTTKYHTEISNSVCTVRDTITVQVTTKDYVSKHKVFLPNDTIYCKYPVQISPKYSFNYTLWDNNSTTVPRKITAPGTYWLTAADGSFCPKIRDSIVIGTDSVPKFKITGDTIICDKDSSYISVAEIHGYSITWKDGSKAKSRWLKTAKIYTVYASSKCTTDSIRIKPIRLETPNLLLTPDTQICGNAFQVKIPRQTQVSYLWENGDTTLNRLLPNQGNYILYAAGYCGKDTAPIKISTIPIPGIQLACDTLLCGKDTCHAHAVSNTGSLKWSTGETTKDVVLQKNQKYWVVSKNQCGKDSLIISTRRIEFPKVTLPADTTFCNGPALYGPPRQKGTTQFWENGDTNLVRLIANSGYYKITISNACGFDSLTRHVTISQVPKLQVQADAIVCKGSTAFATLINPPVSWLWSTGDKTTSTDISKGGWFWVVSKNTCGQDSVSFLVTLKPKPQIALATDTIACTNPVSIGISPQNGTSYHWSDGTAGSTRLIQNPGTYRLIADNGCPDSASINVQFDQIPTLVMGPDTFVCTGAEVTLKDNIATGSSTYLWKDGDRAMPRVIHKPGLYELSKTNTCGTATDQVYVADSCNYCLLWVPNAFNPGDGSVANPSFRAVLSCRPLEFRLIIYNRWGENMFESANPKQGWDGTFMGKRVPSGVYVAMVTALVPDGNINVRKSERTSITILD